jgi:hypothetical protein
MLLIGRPKPERKKESRGVNGGAVCKAIGHCYVDFGILHNRGDSPCTKVRLQNDAEACEVVGKTLVTRDQRSRSKVRTVASSCGGSRIRSGTFSADEAAVIGSTRYSRRVFYSGNRLSSKTIASDSSLVRKEDRLPPEGVFTSQWHLLHLGL